MNFVSIEFAAFTICVCSIYWLLKPNRERIWFLTLASYVFYAVWDWRFLFLMVFVTLNAYLAGLALAQMPKDRHRLVLVSSIGTDLAVLAIFKYLNFFSLSAHSTAGLLGLDVNFPIIKVVLPVGISFYTFHAISYVMDVHRGKVEAQRSFSKIAMYISFFPQLIAGPIVRASFFMPQLRLRRSFKSAQLGRGLQLFVHGVIYKAVIADTLAQICDPIFGSVASASQKDLITASAAFYGQIYFDFAGYSLMAIGSARFFGYRLPRNFNYPYSSLSVTEFWRRWHISLSSWLRDYLYVPLGGNRGGAVLQYRNLMITMVLGGLWHGASWNFVAWGTLHGIGLCCHKLWLSYRPALVEPWTRRSGYAAASLLLTQAWVFIAWIFFRASTFEDAAILLAAVASPGAYLQIKTSDALFWIIAVVALDHVLGRARLLRPAEPVGSLRRAYWTALGILAGCALVFMAQNSKSFIYFQF